MRIAGRTEAPGMAGMLVSTADLSGPVGPMQEASALFRSIVASGRQSSRAVAKAAAEELQAESRPETQDLPRDNTQARQALIAGCMRAGEIVARHSPDEAQAYREWLLAVATATSNAAKDATGPGVRRKRLGEGEKGALGEPAAAPGVNPLGG